jgi:hypothetical protein
VTRRRNLAPLGGLAAGLLAVVGYFGLVLTQSPRWTPLLELPLLHLVLLAAGLVLSALGLYRAFAQPSLYRGRVIAPVLGALNLGLAALFCFYLFSYSYRLPAAEAAPRPGAPAPDFALANERGELVRLSALGDRKKLLVFYRGFW